MRGLTSYLLMAVLFSTGCATTKTKTPFAHVAAQNISLAKAHISEARKAGEERLDWLLADTEKSLDSVACAVKNLEKSEQNALLKAGKLQESTDFWRKRYLEATGKLNFWRWLFFGILGINLSVAAAAFAVSRVKPLSIL